VNWDIVLEFVCGPCKSIDQNSEVNEAIDVNEVNALEPIDEDIVDNDDLNVDNVDVNVDNVDVNVDNDDLNVDNVDQNNTTVNVSLIPYIVRPQIQEEQLENMSIHADQHNSTFELTFNKVDLGTKRGKINLFDSRGYAYNVKRKYPYSTEWQCTVRSKHVKCRATVSERGGIFSVGKFDHCHQPTKGEMIKSSIAATVKQVASAQVFKSAGSIVQEALTEHIEEDYLPKPSNLERVANRHRQKQRPAEPKTLFFILWKTTSQRISFSTTSLPAKTGTLCLLLLLNNTS
jgi:hypothetical protein